MNKSTSRIYKNSGMTSAEVQAEAYFYEKPCFA